MKLIVSPKVEGRGLRMRTLPGFNGNIVTILQAGEILETLDAENLVKTRLGEKDQWLHVKNLEAQSGYCAAWLLVETGSQQPLENLFDAPTPDTRLQQNPELKFISRHPFMQSQAIRPVATSSSELTPLSALQPQVTPHSFRNSSELTPLPALQPLPEIPEILPPPATTLIHSVAILSQGDLYGNAACSPVSACMLLEYYHQLNPLNRTITPQQLIAMLDPGDGIPGKGMSLSNVTDELLSLGYQHISEKLHASLDDLRSELIKGPFIVTVGVTLVSQGPRRIQGPGNTNHAMVVKGFTPDEIIVNDPWAGKELRFPDATFESMWKLGSNGMYMIRP